MEKTPRIFTLFPKLEQKLRLEVWNWAVESDDEPRIFEIGKTDDVEGLETPALSNVKIAKLSCPATPALLHVCQESREQALKKYQVLNFRNQTVFIDFDVDWIFFPQDNGLEPRREGDEKWWVWKRALVNEGYWPLIRNIAMPAFVWANLLEPRRLEDGTLKFEWPKELEGMPDLTQAAMVFELWAQWEDGDQGRFATKGPVEFGRFEDFCFSGLAFQWVAYAKHTMEEIKKLKLPWNIPKVNFVSVKRGGGEPLMNEVMREKYGGIEAEKCCEESFEIDD